MSKVGAQLNSRGGSRPQPSPAAKRKAVLVQLPYHLWLRLHKQAEHELVESEGVQDTYYGSITGIVRRLIAAAYPEPVREDER